MSNFEDIRRYIKSEFFDYQTVMHFFKDLKKPRDKLSSWLKEQKIIRLKKGIYVFGEKYRNSLLSLEVLANSLYGPSYVSFEYALFYYGMIAERPTVITSASLGDSKIFSTPIGTFTYRSLEKEKFKIGIEYKDMEELGGYFIASKEKALIDLIHRTPGIRSLSELRYYLFEEMRMDESVIKELNKDKIQAISSVYKKKSVSLIACL